jgi:protein O-GlcNAc transferase
MSPISSLPTPPECLNADTTSDALTELQTAIDGFEATPNAETAARLKSARLSAARVAAALNRRELQNPAVRSFLDLVGQLARTGALDEPASEDDQALLASWSQRGWPGLIAAMLTTPAWRWNDAPVFSAVPDWLWRDYATWVFAAPALLASRADCGRYAAHVARHSDELARWAQRNIGSASVRAAVEIYGERNPLLPLRFADVDIRIAAESRAKILQRLFVRTADPFEPMLTSRFARPLRVGFVARHWDQAPDQCAALAKFEHLPADRFERVLFAIAEPASAFGMYCRDKAVEFRVLPLDLTEQVTALRDANLDVVVFVGDIATANDELGRLPLYRLAPLQVVDAAVPTTSGFPENDLIVVSHDLAVSDFPARCSERIAVSSGPSASFALQRGSEAEIAYSREDLGFSADAVLLLAILSSVHGAAEQLETWARILAGAPQTRLVIHVVPDRESPASANERFCGLVQLAMAKHGVSLDRLSILAPEEASYGETRAIIRLADLCLAAPTGAAWAAEILAAGVPLVSMEGTTGRILKGEGLAEFAASDEDAFVANVLEFVRDPARLLALREKFKVAAEAGLACLDTLAASDGFGAALETAFDRLESDGRSKFRRFRQSIRPSAEELAPLLESARAALDSGDVVGALETAQRALATSPRDAHVRSLYGRALQANGRADRAAEYFLAAVQQLPEDANLWFALATALRDDGKNSDAIQALETALRLDPGRADAWLLLIDLAEAGGSFEIAQQAYQALKEAAPDHPQIAALGARFES